MQESRIPILATLTGVTLAFGFVLTAPSRSQGGPEAGASQHGGAVELTPHYRFEVVATTTGIRVYPSMSDGKPLDVGKLSCKATFYPPGSTTPWFGRPLAAAANPGQTPEFLERRIDLRKVPAQGVKVAFDISSLPDPSEPAASFTVPFAPVAAPPAPVVAPPAPVVAPRAVSPAPAAITFARSTRSDQAAINAQRVCKVSGEPLGSMGAPIKVTRGRTSVFLCCQGCVKTVQANPDRFLGATR
jgi:hypothetical protein